MIQLPENPDKKFGVLLEQLGTLPPCLYVTKLNLRRSRGGNYSFPPPKDININMMPFIVGFTFKESKLPDYVEPYWPMIEACLYPEMERSWFHMWPKSDVPSEIGKVNFLTIQESWVEAETSQRRAGLHVERSKNVNFKNGNSDETIEGKGTSLPYCGHPWGDGCAHRGENYATVLKGGIYIASTVASSCRVWNCGVDQEAIGR